MSEFDQDYFRIRLTSLHASRELTFDVYLLLNNKYVHYLRAGDKISQEKLDNFKVKAPDSFFINMGDKQAYKDYVSECLNSDDLNSEEKALLLRESSLAMVEELFVNEDVSIALKDAKGIITSFVNFLDSEPEAISHLIGLSTHDFYTYNHSLDVSIYCLALGNTVGYGLKDLQELGEGSLFHDIGKIDVSVEIICKAGPLNDDEWAQMQKHPQYGLAILNEQDVSEAIIACCFEHHENFLGNGYPQQLTGKEIHPMARFVAITDTYDALTTKRTYNTPMAPAQALEFMSTKLKGKYDPDLLKAMHSSLFHMEELLKKNG